MYHITKISQYKGKTLRVKTNPISSSSSEGSGDGGSPVLTYIRVVAVLGSDSSISNRPLSMPISSAISALPAA